MSQGSSNNHTMKISHFFPKNSFKGKTVFITGGGSGINLGIARNFAAVGANLVICGRTQERLEKAKSELESFGVKVFAQTADVRDFDQIRSVLKNSKFEIGPIDVLVCGAGGNFPCEAKDLSATGFKSVVDIDLLGSFNTCRAAFNQLKETKGSIIFISACQSFMPAPIQCHVGAAKAGVDNLMKNLALEWGPYGIRSNSVSPGPIEGTQGVKALAPGDLGKAFKKAIPLGRLGTTDDIGQLCVFLASPLASYITGTLIVADGGQCLPGAGIYHELVVKAMEGSSES